MQNNIKDLLEQKEVSIKQLSTVFNDNYSFTHLLVNRKDLSETQAGTLKKTADFLGVSIEDLYK